MIPGVGPRSSEVLVAGLGTDLSRFLSARHLAAWNILFPGEPPEEYERVAQLIPLLSHLSPPTVGSMIRLDRFSPNFDEAEKSGFVDIMPYPSYHYIYPLAPESVVNLAYYFAFRYRETQDVKAYAMSLAKQIATWQEVHHNSALFFVDKGSHLLIWDFRPVAHRPLTVLTGIHRALYLACDCIRTGGQLQQLVDEEFTGVLKVEQILHPPIERYLMLREGNAYLSLAIPLGEYSPNADVLKRFYETVKMLGKASQMT